MPDHAGLADPSLVPSTGNLGATLRDTALVISAPLENAEPATPAWNKTTLKALLRSARALDGLGKLDDALDVLWRMRVLEGEMGDDQDVGKAVRAGVERKVETRDRKAREKSEKERRAREGEAALRAAILVSTADGREERAVALDGWGALRC